MHRSVCICGLLPRLATRTRVLLVVHQLEAKKPTNTGVVAARCLANSAVIYRGRAPVEPPPDDPSLDGESLPGLRSVGPADADPLDAELRADVEPVLLFPHPTARPLETWRGSEKPVLLVVPDGTWSQAARTRIRLGALAQLPCASVQTCDEAVAVDRLRRPPGPGRLATLEALALALGVLEDPAVADALMRVYRIMTERTLWTNGRLTAAEVTGGIPAGARSHDPLNLR